MKKLFYILFIVISCFACKNDKDTYNPDKATKEDGSDKKIVNSIGETLKDDARKLVENWQEYQTVEETLLPYYNITPSNALSNAKTLSNAAKQLKDSIRVEQFKSDDFKIRFNVFYNYTLRLTDMESINSIKNEEVELEVDNIINAFSAINSKINNLIEQKRLEEEVKNFEE